MQLGKTMILLLGPSAVGKTYALTGPRARGKRLGETHVGIDCLMSRFPWREGAPTTPRDDGTIRAGKTRVVELTVDETLIAMPWSFDSGSWNEAGRLFTLNELFTRDYATVIVDSIVQAASSVGPRISARLSATGIRTTVVRFEGPTHLSQRDGGGKAQHLGTIQTYVDRWRQAGATVTTITPPYVNQLCAIIRQGGGLEI